MIYNMDKQILFNTLINNNDLYLDEDEQQYLISLVRSDIMMDEFMKLHPHNLNR